MALISTIGGATSNSYISVSDASTYFTGRLGADAWTDASSSDKEAALMMATARLEAETYTGSKVSLTQRLSWPRYSSYDRDGMVFATTEIPLVIQQATFEYALALLQEPTLLGDTGLEGFVNVQLGSMNITPRVGLAAKLPEFVKQLIAPVRLGGMGGHVARA